MFSGRQEFMGQSSVIGDQKETFCVFIQPSHREKIFSLFLRDQIYHCFVPFILCGGHHPRRFIQHIILQSGIGNLPSLHRHQIFSGVDLTLGIFHGRTVYLNRPFFYLFLYFASGPQTHICQKFVQSDHSHYISLQPG